MRESTVGAGQERSRSNNMDVKVSFAIGAKCKSSPPPSSPCCYRAPLFKLRSALDGAQPESRRGDTGPCRESKKTGKKKEPDFVWECAVSILDVGLHTPHMTAAPIALWPPVVYINNLRGDF
ncbi:hypothetical protein DAPPUDRAFT_95018 [Daphnia pulex]|uniref:Uncharacterized protein n=1 Tax=Daphnia pulex TaxID=6669 RepID=E9FTQ7_DAPPU|nr:hypothetical protein DAPPUDRAFT_95018 [Daphnia pulex]|eukprot:EFX89410.1 hypothetical protein DAPPUDRAFT_95018 [Daphnia pulex]